MRQEEVIRNGIEKDKRIPGNNKHLPP